MPRQKKTKEKSPWPDRLQRMKDYQKANFGSWQRNVKLLGNEEGGEPSEQSSGYGWGLVEMLCTSVLVQNPDMLCEAYSPAQDEGAKLMSGICNYDFDQMNMEQVGNMLIMDNFWAGYGAVIETVNSETEAKRFPGTEDGEGGAELLDLQQEYSAKRIPPKDILFDPQGTLLDLSDHRYLAIAFFPTIKEIQEDPLFENHLPDKIEDYPESSTFDKGGRESMSPMKSLKGEMEPQYKTVQCWEIHDKIGEEIIYMTDFGNHELGRIPWPFKLKFGKRKLFPVTMLAFYPSPTGFYPKPLLDMISPQLNILYKLDNRMYTDTLTKWRKFATWANCFAEDQLAKLTDPIPENAIMIADTDIIDELAGTENHPMPNLAEIIVPLKDPAPNQDTVAVRDIAMQEITDIIGFGAPGRGGMPKTRSAREAMAIREKLDNRMGKYISAITKFYEHFGQKHILILQQTMNVERYAKVLIEEASKIEAWKSYTKDDIAGTFHFVVYPGTSTQRNTESKRAQEMALFNAVAPILQASGLPLAPAFMRLATAFQWKGVDQLFKNYKLAAKNLAKVLFQMGQGQMNDPSKSAEILKAATASVMASLSDSELAMLKQEMAGGGGRGQAPAQKGESGQGDKNPLGTSAGTF